MDPIIGTIHYNDGTDYIALYDDLVAYHYEDEVAVLPLLGRDAMLADRNEVLMTSARRAQTATFSALALSAAARDALVALWATQTTHNDGSGEAARNVTVTKVDTQVYNWSGATPAWKVTLTVRTR